MLTNKLQKITTNCVYKFVIWGGLLVSPVLAVPEGSEINATGSMTPDLHEEEIFMGETLSLERKITVNIEDIVEETVISSAPEKLDILFLADNTDSMTPAITNVQDNAQSILRSLTDKYGDVQFGVARYYGDPKETRNQKNGVGDVIEITTKYTFQRKETCSNRQGETRDCYIYLVEETGSDGSSRTQTKKFNLKKHKKYGRSYTETKVGQLTEKTREEIGALGAYELQESVNGGSHSDTITAINNWSASSGRDWSEGNFFALHQAATSGNTTESGYSTGFNTGWRNDAKKVIVWFGDAQSHTMTLNQQEVISALEAQNISVVAIHTKSTEQSETQGLDGNFQASSIANATSGQYASVYSDDLSNTITTLIGTTVTLTETYSPGMNLVFDSVEGVDSEALAGLDITYTCIDPLGCNSIEDGDERLFRMDIQANQAGTYNFKTIAEDVEGAEANNLIIVKLVYPD